MTGDRLQTWRGGATVKLKQHHSGARATAALIASLAVVLAACNAAAPSATTSAASQPPAASGASGASSAPASAGAPASALTGNGIVFGDLHPFTGQYASVGTHSFAGAKAAEACINDAGGVLGQKLTVTSADTVGDPADAVPALNKLLAVDKAVAILGPGGLEIGGTQPILDNNKIPFMFEGGLSAMDNNTDPLLWRDTPSDSQEGVAMALYALSKGYKNAALVFSTIQSAQDFKEPVKTAYEKQGGTIAVEIDLSPGQTSYRSEALRVANAHPDVIFTQMEPGTAGAFFSGMKSLNNLAIPFIASDTSVGADWISAITGPIAEAHLVSVEGSSAPGPGGDAYTACYKEANGDIQPGGNTPYAYDGTMVLALAIDLAGSTDSAKVVAALPNVSSPTAGAAAVTTYKDALAAIKAGATTINYEGAGTPMDFNGAHNVFGPFDVVQWSQSANKFQTVTTISAQDLEHATGG
jgi:ABC-type branched-subunit amino acid transport system substrate-binding protein